MRPKAFTATGISDASVASFNAGASPGRADKSFMGITTEAAKAAKERKLTLF